MTLHQAVADTLAARRAEIVNDIQNTSNVIVRLRDELERANAAYERLLTEMRAIDDAVELLTNLNGQEPTT